MAVLGDIDDIVNDKVDIENKKSARIQKAEATQEKSIKDINFSSDPTIEKAIEATGQMASNIVSGLRGRVQAEKDIANRPDAMETLKKELEFNPGNLSMGEKILKSTVETLKRAAVVDERVQGTIMGPLYELQDPFRKDVFKDATLAAIEGIRGKRKVRLQDLITSRIGEVKIGNTDIGKPIAIIGGLAGEISTGTRLASMAKGMFHGGPQTLKSIQKSLDFAEETKRVVGNSIEKMFESPVGKKLIEPIKEFNVVFKDGSKKITSIKQTMDELPEGVIQFIKKRPKTFGVVFEKGTDIVENSTKNIWKLRMALDDMLTSTDFAGKSTKIKKELIKKGSNQLRAILSGTDEQIAPLMAKYSEYSEALSDASKILTQNGKVVANKAASALRGGGEPGKQLTLDVYASLFPHGAKMIQDVKLLNRNRATASAGLLLVKTAIASGILSQFIKKPAKEFISDSPPSSGGGGG